MTKPIVLLLLLLSMVAGAQQERKKRTVVETEHFYLGSCPDDVDGDRPENHWTVTYDDDAQEGTATCTHIIYAENGEQR